MTSYFEILAPAFLVMLAAICKAVSDTIADHPWQSVFRGDWWDKNKSWRNKWKGGLPANGERFPGSSTALVFLTDGWHFFNMVQYSAFILAVVLYWPVYGWLIDAVLLKCIFSITFEVFYRWVLVRRK